MEEANHTRVSSGIYDGQYGGHNPFGSAVSLPGGQAGPSRFEEGAEAHGGVESEVDNQSIQQQQSRHQEYQPPWYIRRWFLVTLLCLGIIGIALIFVLLYPLVRAIAQHVLLTAEINVQHAVITNPQNGSFPLVLGGVIWHTGVIYAELSFNQPVNVSWLEDTNTITPLGYMELNKVYADHKEAVLNQTTLFHITDEAAFGRFTVNLITQPNFTWRLICPSIKVQAVHFPVDDNMYFAKDVHINAINNFDNNIILEDLQLPGAAPGGGLTFAATTILRNPSPFEVALGDLTFGLTYDGMYLGQGKATNVNLVAENNTIVLNGVLEAKNSTQDLAKLSTLFTNYLNGDASDVVAQGSNVVRTSDGTEVSWLSAGLKALILHVPFKPTSPINPIRAITVDYLDLVFRPDTAWSPNTTSNAVRADLQLPFGFPLGVNNIQNFFNITQGGNTAAGLTTPVGAASASVQVLSPNDTRGTINITLAPGSVLTSNLADHGNFANFVMNFTNANVTEFRLDGHARAQATTPVGTIILDPLKVNVSTSLNGVRGLKGYVTIQSVDLVGGTADHLNLVTGLRIENPSSLNLDTGDLALNLVRNGSVVGVNSLAGLKLNRGNNTINGTATFNPNVDANGQLTLNQFVAGTNVDLTAKGYDASTNVSSLLMAFESLDIPVVLPGLKSPLINSASLFVLPTTGKADNISHVTVNLDNPFTAVLGITSTTSRVTSHGIVLGNIASNTSFSLASKTNSSSPTLDLNLNMDPASLLTLTRRLATEAGLSTEQLDIIVQLGNYSYIDSTDQDYNPVKRELNLEKRDNIFTGFNILNYVLTAFKRLQSDIELTAQIKVGDYATSLAYNQTRVPVVTDDSLSYILQILATPIVQKIVDGVTLGVDTVLISDPAQTRFNTHLTGNIGNAGPFDADITFPSGLVVNWNGAPLGTISLTSVHVTGDQGARLDNDAAFAVADVNHLTEFTKVLLTEESFVWSISGTNLSVAALGIVIPGINFPAKEVTLKGFNSLKGGVSIQSFDLPSNDDAGGIHLTVQSTVTNPSQVGISLSTIAFNAFFGQTELGPLASQGSLTLSPSTTSPLSLVGRLIPQNDQSGLDAVSTVFNNFIQGQNSDVTVQGTGAGPSDVTWLNEGIKALRVATVLPNQGKLDVIKSIALNELTLDFTTNTAYNPATSTSDTVAAFTLPFAFPVDITGLDVDLVTSTGGNAFAHLDIPRSGVRTDVGPRLIHITFNNVPLAAYGDKHNIFSDFLAATTTGGVQTLGLSGPSNAAAGTAVGTLQLKNIDINVQSQLQGLEGLDSRPVTVANLDVARGYPDYLLINLDTALYNPSTITIGTGDVSFSLLFQDQTIGTANLANLVIVPGNKSYATGVHFQPEGGAVGAGRNLLENYISGIDSSTAIRGSYDSTPIDSLKQALSEISISPVTIPSLHQKLIISTSLVFPKDIVKTGIATATFILDNPFTASINIEEVYAKVTYRDLTIGEIDHQRFTFNAPGHKQTGSPNIPFKFNLDPITIISLIRDAAQDHNVALGPLNDLFAIALQNPNFKSDITTSVDDNSPQCSSGQQFDVNGAILAALKGLAVNLALDTDLRIDEYPTSLSFTQSDVPAITDNTALYLIGAVAPPIVQALVNQAVLKVNGANVTNLSDDGFDLALSGSLTNIGPLDAQIIFVEPLNVIWKGKRIATIALPPVCAAANSGVPNYTPKARLTIVNLGDFTDFATELLHTESFTWDLTTDKLRVIALGTIFDNVSLSKSITLKAFNNLPGVTITRFNLPSDDPAGGIHISTAVAIPSPAQLGIDLGTVTFDAYYDSVRLGPLTGDNLILPPQATVTESLEGRIEPQRGNDLQKVGQLFTDFLQGKNISLIAKGVSVVPTGSNTPVSWLSTAFKTLSLPVTLMGVKYTIIQSITVNDFGLKLLEANDNYNARASSNNTLATYKNPFGFSLRVINTAADITLAVGGANAATLTLPAADTPNAGASTGNVADLPLSFRDARLKSVNNGAYETLLREATDTAGVNLVFSGSADVTARTSIGDVPIADIAFTNIASTLKGINGFGGQATISNLKVTGSTADYVIAPLDTGLNNPSQISLSTNNVALSTVYDTNKAVIGRAVIDPLNLVPGSASYPTEFRYQPPDRNSTGAQKFLADFLQQSGTLPAIISGDSGSTPYSCLVPALEGLKLNAAIPGFGAQIIRQINVKIGIEALTSNEVVVNIDLFNPLDTPLYITYIQADAYFGGSSRDDIYAQFAHFFDPPFVVPAGGVANSGDIDHVVLPKTVFGSIVIINQNLDIQSAATAHVGSAGGYEVPYLHVDQTNVPTHYDADLFGSLASGVTDIENLLKGVLGSLVRGGTRVDPRLSSLVPTSTISSVASAASSAASSVVSSVESRVSSAVNSVTSQVASAAGGANSVVNSLVNGLLPRETAILV